jgi:hypothetical protein
MWVTIRPISRISQREETCWLLNCCKLLNKNSESWNLRLDNILEYLFIRDWTAGTHFLTFWAVSLLVSTMGHTATGVGSRLPVADDMPPSYAESWLDSCGQCTATEITLLNQSNNLYAVYTNKFLFSVPHSLLQFLCLSEPKSEEQGMNAWLEFSDTSVRTTVAVVFTADVGPGSNYSCV